MILCYHAVEPGWSSPLVLPPEEFAAQCAWLARRRRVIDLPEAFARADRRGRLPPGTAAVTFDDGFAALREHALPALSRHRLPATVFLVAQTLSPEGKAVDWVDTPPPWALRTLALDDVLEMQEAGVRFGSHTWAHLDMTTTDDATCERDLRDSRDLLEDLLGRPVPYLAYPRGRHSARVRRAAERAGYTFALSLPEGPEPIGRFAVPRVGVYPGNGLSGLRIKTSRAYLPVRMSRAWPAVRSALRRGRAVARRI